MGLGTAAVKHPVRDREKRTQVTKTDTSQNASSTSRILRQHASGLTSIVKEDSRKLERKVYTSNNDSRPELRRTIIFFGPNIVSLN